MLESYFTPFQIERIMDRSRFMFDEKARRVGLTYAYAFKYTAKRAKSDGKTWYTANDAASVLEFIDYVGHFARVIGESFDSYDEGMAVANEKDILTKVVRFKSGGQVVGLSSNPNALHGKGGDVILDEYAYHQQAAKMWEAGVNSAKRGDDLVVLSTHTSISSEFNRTATEARQVMSQAESAGIPIHTTPDARGRFSVTPQYREFALARGVLPWSHRKTTIHDAVAGGMVDTINRSNGGDMSAEEFLLECRASCKTESQWKRQYLCQPAADAESFLPYDLIIPCTSEDCFTPPSTWMNVFQGQDFGRRGHLSVMANGEVVGDVLWTREIKRMAKMPWEQQLSIIGERCRHPHFQRGSYDRNGMGDMPVETLQNLFGAHRINGNTMSAPAKHNLAIPFQERFKKRTIRIPNDPKLIDVLSSVEQSVSVVGRHGYDAASTDSGHADEFWALALMNEAASLPVVQLWALTA